MDKPESKTLDRRGFFRQALQRTGRTVVQQADAQVRRRAAHWIRPPFALDELEFLLACTRCGDCATACPHQVIFPLPARLGAQVTATPAMDLLNRACHLCEGWPCVTACAPGAMQVPEPDEDVSSPLPRLAHAWVDSDACLPYSGPECGACAGSCPVPGALEWRQEKPHINPALCTGCALCRDACIVQPRAIRIKSVYSGPVTEVVTA